MQFLNALSSRLLLLAFIATSAGCKSTPPPGTTPPTAGERVSSTAAPGTAEPPAPPQDGQAAPGTGESPPPTAKTCPAEVSDTPTVLFNNQVFLRAPKGVEILEENPTLARTAAPFVSTCDATVDRVTLVVFQDNKQPDLGTFAKELLGTLEAQGYKNPTQSAPEKQAADELRFVVDYPADGATKAARIYVVALRKFGKIYTLLYQAEPGVWPALVASFQESANRLIVAPPAGKTGKGK